MGVAGVVEGLRIVKDDEIEAIREPRPSSSRSTRSSRARGPGARSSTWLARPGKRARARRRRHRLPTRSWPPVRPARAARRARREAIAPGSLVTIDIGAVLDGYHSDCTHVRHGPSPTRWAVYELVLRAQLAGLDGAAQCHRQGRRRDRTRHHHRGRPRQHFQHGTGHGVGPDHEDPRLSAAYPAPSSGDGRHRPGVYLLGPGCASDLWWSPRTAASASPATLRS